MFNSFWFFLKKEIGGAMKKNHILILGLCMFLTIGSSGSVFAEKTYLMRGDIRVISLDTQTVVIEVPVGKKLFTVGGPLSDNGGSALRSGSVYHGTGAGR